MVFYAHLALSLHKMKSTRCTYHVALAVVLLMLLTLFPHHHHDGGAACWRSEICHDDGRANDVHTRHHAGDNHHLCYWHSVQNVAQRTLPSHLAAVPYPASYQPNFGSNATLLSPLRERHSVAKVPFLLPFAALANTSRGVARLHVVDKHILIFILISTTQHNT